MSAENIMLWIMIWLWGWVTLLAWADSVGTPLDELDWIKHIAAFCTWWAVLPILLIGSCSDWVKQKRRKLAKWISPDRKEQ